MSLPSNDPSATSCVGTIQANPSVDQGKLPGDIILGVPFLRNVYVVHDLGSEGSTNRNPRLGVASLTNATLAATEFQNVRVKNLNPDGSNGITRNSVDQPTGDGMKTALKIGIGVLCFVVGCVVLFVLLWYSRSRRLRQERQLAKKFEPARLGGASNSYRVLLLAGETADKHVKTQDKRGFLERLFARKGYHQAGNGGAMELTEDELRMKRFEEYKRRQAQEERDSMWSQSTRVRDTLVGDDHGLSYKCEWNMDEFGAPLDLDEQRGRQMKDETCSSGSARSRTLSPGLLAAERTLTGHQLSNRERSNYAGAFPLKLDISQATFTSLNQPTRTVGPPRTPLAVEPSLSPLTEAADSRLVTPVTITLQQSILSHPDIHRSASPEGSADAPDPDFYPIAVPTGSVALFTHKSETPSAAPTTRPLAVSPSSTLRGPRPLLSSRNPYRKSLLLKGAPSKVESPSTKANEAVMSGSPSTTLPPSPIATSSGRGLAGPSELSPYMGAPTNQSQWTPVPPAPWPQGMPPPTLSPSAPTAPQPPTSHSVQPIAYFLAHGPLPPGAAPPMTRQQSIELFPPTDSSSPSFNIPLLSSRAFAIPPNTPPANVGSSRTTPATFIPFGAPPDGWIPPPITPITDAATPLAEILPTVIPPPLSSVESTEELIVTPGGRSGSNSGTPTASLPPSSIFPNDGHSADPLA